MHPIGSTLAGDRKYSRVMTSQDREVYDSIRQGREVYYSIKQGREVYYSIKQGMEVYYSIGHDCHKIVTGTLLRKGYHKALRGSYIILWPC